VQWQRHCHIRDIWLAKYIYAFGGYHIFHLQQSRDFTNKYGGEGTPHLGREKNPMGRNLYILAATLTLLAAISVIISFTNIAEQPGSPGDAALWKTTGLALFVIALVVALAGTLSSLFEQAERRAEDARRAQRKERNR